MALMGLNSLCVQMFAVRQEVAAVLSLMSGFCRELVNTADFNGLGAVRKMDLVKCAKVWQVIAVYLNGGGRLQCSAVVRAAALCLMVFAGSTSAAEKIIIDTDMGADVDDVGAVAIANYYMGTGQAELLGVMVSNIGTQGGWAAAASDAVNTYYQHPNVALGTNRGPATAIAGDGSNFTRLIGSNASRYGHDHSQFDAAENAVTAYRRILSSQPDKSVNLVVVGWMSNIANLMDSEANYQGDGIHSTGKQLLERKLKRLVVMGGRYPSGTEFNFKLDGPSAAKVMSNLQTPMIFTGYELGTLVQTGQSLVNTPVNNPVREAYRLYGKGVEPFNRSSWDLTAVLYVVEGLGDYFSLSASGKNQVNNDGSNTWSSGHSKGDYYLKLKDSQARYRLQSRLNQILQAAPVSEPQFVCGLSVELMTSNPSCSSSNGSINSSVSGGTAPYQYAWSNGETGQSASTLGAGGYSLKVTDSNGCTASQSVALSSLSMLADIQHASDTQLGQVNLSLSGGRVPLSFSWSNGSTEKDIRDLAAGSYSVSVSDAAGCTLDKAFAVEQLVSSPTHFLEAECAVSVGSKWTQLADGNASGQMLVATEKGVYNLLPDGSSSSTLRYELDLDTSGDYSMYAHLLAADGGQDSIWYRINKSDWVAWHVGLASSLQWKKLATPVAFLSGRNTLEIAFREGGLRLDKLYITQGTRQPEGVSDEATNCSAESCPVAGSACDDGDATTSNDRADGVCGCAGTQLQVSSSSTFEAECAAKTGSNWQAFTHSDAAAGSAIRVAVENYNLVRSPASPSQVSFYIDQDEAADLQLFARVSAPSSSSDSIWFRINNSPWQLWHMGRTEGFEWRRWWAGVELIAGINTIDFAYREGGLELDKISVLNTTSLPNGLGEASTSCEVQSCPSAGLSCDDGDDSTFGDVTDGDCNCAGEPSVFDSVAELVSLEAECAGDRGGLWTSGSSLLASADGFVAVPLGIYNIHKNGDSETELRFPFSVESAGEYFLSMHTLTPDGGSDSLWFKVDEGAWNAWHLNVFPQFNWQQYFGSFDLSAGSHTVRVAYREGGLQLDKLVLSQGGTSFTGTGPTASNCP